MRGYKIFLTFFIFLISLQGVLYIYTTDIVTPSINGSSEDLSKHWTTKTGRSIIEDYFQNTRKEKFFAMVDTLGVSHQIQIKPFTWFFMEECVTPQIGMKIQLYDPSNNLFNESLINYGEYSTLIIEFIPRLTGEWTLTLIEEYGDADQWDNEYGWESGEVTVDFLGFQYVYTFHDEIDIDFRRIRSVEETYNMYLYVEDSVQNSITFHYLAYPIGSRDAVDDISIFTLDNEEIFRFSPDSHEDYQTSISLKPNTFYRVQTSEALSSYTMIYSFTFKRNDGTHLPLYLQNLEGSFPSSFPIIEILEDFDNLVPYEFDALTVSQDIANDTVVESKGANKINYEFSELGENWVELYVINVDNPLDFTSLKELSIWIHGDGQRLKFYYYLNNAEWGDLSHTWLDFSGAMLWEVEISHIGWENIHTPKDEFFMVQFSSFNFSQIARISIGISPLLSSVTNGITYLDAFSAKFEPVISSSSFSSSLQLETSSSSSLSTHLPEKNMSPSITSSHLDEHVPSIEVTPGFESPLILIIFISFGSIVVTIRRNNIRLA